MPVRSHEPVPVPSMPAPAEHLAGAAGVSVLTEDAHASIAGAAGTSRRMSPAALDAFLPSDAVTVAQGPRFYQSNNTGQLGLQEALDRLNGPEQVELRAAVQEASRGLLVLSARDAVGTYRSFEDAGDRTAENTVVLSLEGTGDPVLDALASGERLAFARDLAARLHQESVLLFEPDPQGLSAQVLFHFDQGHLRPSPVEVNAALDPVLPAYSLQLGDDGKVAAVEVLGYDTPIAEVHDALMRLENGGPDRVDWQSGRASLVFQNGATIEI